MRHAFRVAMTAALLTGLWTALPGHALPNEDDEGGAIARNPDYVLAAKLIRGEKYSQAIPLLKNLLLKDGRDADAHNLLGFGTRKLGRFEEALAHYKKALSIKPGHRGAHEYIGETYLALGRLDEARKHLAFLDDDCWLPCEEYTDLKKAVAAYLAKAGR